MRRRWPFQHGPWPRSGKDSLRPNAALLLVHKGGVLQLHLLLTAQSIFGRSIEEAGCISEKTRNFSSTCMFPLLVTHSHRSTTFFYVLSAVFDCQIKAFRSLQRAASISLRSLTSLRHTRQTFFKSFTGGRTRWHSEGLVSQHSNCLGTLERLFKSYIGGLSYWKRDICKR